MRFSRHAFGVMVFSMMFLASVVDGNTVESRKIEDVLKDPALHVTHLSRYEYIGVAKAGKRLVAVGRYGHIVLSDDNGATWRQAKSVPVRVGLVAVSFATPQKGWAVGHSGAILRTEDGGENWTLQLDGIKAAQLVFDSVTKGSDGKKGTSNPTDPKFISAKRLVDDGPDKPFLNILVESEEKAFVVGAYNLIFRTEDGGKSWQPMQSRVDNPRELHLYAMGRSGQDYYLAGEQGLLLRSSDGGNSFKRLNSPYQGSFFGLLATKESGVFIYGLRGNVFHSVDGGRSWKKIEFDLPRSISSGIELEGGTLLLATFPGDIFVSRDHGSTFQPFLNQVPSMISGVVQDSVGGILTVGPGGLRPIGDLAKIENRGKGGSGK